MNDQIDLRVRLERCATRVGDVPPAYQPHLAVILAAFEALIDEMVDQHRKTTP